METLVKELSHFYQKIVSIYHSNILNSTIGENEKNWVYYRSI